MKHILLIVTGALLLTAATNPNPGRTAAAEGSGPSFSCVSARTAVEKAVCADPALSSADREMARLFALARASAFGSGPSNELAAQRQALTDMRSCEGAAGSLPIGKCLAPLYTRRNFELATAILTREPDKALPVLRRNGPGLAPVLEAIALWAAEPVDASWSAPERATSRKRIAALLLPYLTALQTDEGQSFGWSILSRPGGDSPAVNHIDDIFRSDRHLAAFLNVLGPYLPEETEAGVMLRGLPCSAIVKHPDLLNATGAVFGSTMDNFGFRTDCAHTLPPTPALFQLDRKILDSWPACDGTIRFSAYRAYGVTLDAARLGQSLKTPAEGSDRPRGITAAEIDGVRTELAGYYAKYLAKAPAEAKTMADSAIRAILSAAHSCGT
ncbi:hypothetical protein C1T17_18085 [Sphingobium sp. SCG-1]|uniref:lysozyme inhibitor LprI family protein n=1 Tax=Sphingobium sp. SCG-1 TaxID=2072936 RepID=UPI000CD6AF70|nr:hypothetical protein [Sphingobium sp. SCG-1]AUW59708.1 hypothetical protein C1T17_18085 [Sphingobium sp. SCG-1]